MGQFRDPDWLKLRRKDARFLADYPIFCAKSSFICRELTLQARLDKLKARRPFLHARMDKLNAWRPFLHQRVSKVTSLWTLLHRGILQRVPSVGCLPARILYTVLSLGCLRLGMVSFIIKHIIRFHLSVKTIVYALSAMQSGLCHACYFSFSMLTVGITFCIVPSGL